MPGQHRMQRGTKSPPITAIAPSGISRPDVLLYSPTTR
jgi:hypothetical protein